MADWRLDQRTEETPVESDITILSRSTSTFKTTFKKIKEFIIGTTALTTTDTTVTGALVEINKKATDNATQLNQKVNKTSIINNLSATEEGFVLDARQGKILGNRNHITTAKQNTEVALTTGQSSVIKFDSATDEFINISNDNGNITFKQTGVYLILADMSVYNMLKGDIINFNFGEDGTTRYILNVTNDNASLYSKITIQKIINASTVGITSSIWAENKSTSSKSVHLSNLCVIKLI